MSDHYYLFSDEDELIHIGRFDECSLLTHENYMLYWVEGNEYLIWKNLGNGYEWDEAFSDEISNELKAKVLLLKG